MSRAYEFGVDGVVTKNASEVIRWLTLAAEGGDNEAQRVIAYKLQSVDGEKAIKWYRKIGGKDSYMSIGNIFSRGVGSPPNNIEAIKAWKTALDLGNDEAAERIARHFKETGDYRQALNWYQESWKRPHDEYVAINIILLYMRGGGGIGRDYASAATWFRKSLGSYSDQFWLIKERINQTYNYESDERRSGFAPVDFQAALNELQKLARNGDTDAKFMADSMLSVQQFYEQKEERDKNEERILFGK
jgi:TPR repeat protein